MKPCKECSRQFEYKSNNQRYCIDCQTLTCEICKIKYTNKNHHNGAVKFCSKTCLVIWQKAVIIPPSRKGTKLVKPVWNKGLRWGGVLINCPKCARQFRMAKYRVKKCKTKLYCSAECRSAAAVSPENKRLRRSKEFAAWRKAVFERDNYTCQLCRERGGELHPDHIKQFAYYPELRFDLSNGRTLCASCHRKTPTWGRRMVLV